MVLFNVLFHFYVFYLFVDILSELIYSSSKFIDHPINSVLNSGSDRLPFSILFSSFSEFCPVLSSGTVSLSLHFGLKSVFLCVR